MTISRIEIESEKLANLVSDVSAPALFVTERFPPPGRTGSES